ncbi:PspA/IM30 family protein [Paenibacillus sp. J2TS4]|uniref:PspA/IM30 family protein n=1 Tax=Paenibacillus sp. J2TS4 TaxID=2807194 RepID=UPI001B2E2BF7|nr:PspA/IM30 family protein [Paenibacillus sp. J2TS4]GIP36293.1 phage shock protein A [Paenibacillus sp. J2TS4]
MGILSRFKDVMSSNIYAFLDKAENPEKMINQYLRNLNSDLGAVKAETASVMAAEQRCKRQWDECKSEIAKLQKYAMKALEAGNEDGARNFLEKKAALAPKEADLQQAYSLAATNAARMREMHNKLVSDIGELESRASMLKGKIAATQALDKMNKMGSSVAGANDSLSALGRIEEKVNMAYNEAEALAELRRGPEDEFEALTESADPYDEGTHVEDELAALKEALKNKKQ